MGIVAAEPVVTWAVSGHDSETHNCSNFVFSYFISLYMLVLLFDDDAFRLEFDMPSDKIRESFPILPSCRVTLRTSALSIFLGSSISNITRICCSFFGVYIVN